MGKTTSSRITHRAGKGYTRDLGRKRTPDGRRVQPRFLLGHDRAQAELANLRLEQLWAVIVRDADAQNTHLQPVNESTEPTWEDNTLRMAEAIRKGHQSIVVPYHAIEEVGSQDDLGPIGPSAYATYLHHLQTRYPMIAFVPQSPAAMREGQANHLEWSKRRVMQAQVNAAIAHAAIPTGAGHTLYQAIDGYKEHVSKTYVRGGKPTAWSAVLLAIAERLKDSHADAPLELVTYNTIESIKTYWAARPNGKKTGKPISVDTVRSHIKVLKLFLRWLSRNPDFAWRLPDDTEAAWKVDYSRIMHDVEVAGLKQGVQVFHLPALITLWRYATDFGRVLLLLGLNCGFAQAEIASLRLDEIQLDETPPSIKRVRRKSRVYGEFALWPETVAAINWFAGERKRIKGKPTDLAIVTAKGNPLNTQHIANAWNDLLRRIQHDHPDFARLPFKHLRKTAAQLVRRMSDGETAGVFLCHGQPVQSDELSDAYTNRDFTKVAKAMERVHDQLAPMFATKGDAFQAPRKHSGANISRGTIDRIRQLHEQGMAQKMIAQTIGVSAETVRRHTAAVITKV
ncbi:MAG: hypothetical protein WD042_05315 [Phycisphaeraceae bacterium]